jgi:hypothetical protein
MSTITWRDVFLTALHMHRMRRPRMQISYAELAGRQTAGSRIDYPCRVDLASPLRKWYRSGPEGVKRRVHTKTGDSQWATCGILHCIELCHLSLDNGVGNRQCQTSAWVC